jgi:hypothetical protein
LGGGTYKLSKFLSLHYSNKVLYAVDIFNPNFDLTKDIKKKTMKEYYQEILKNFNGKTQLEIFSEITRDCENIVVLKGDSSNTVIPTDKICFGFIDGNHSHSYLENDFYLIWNKLVPGGVLAFHDYKYKLPKLTKKIDELVNRHSEFIRESIFKEYWHILFLIKK